MFYIKRNLPGAERMARLALALCLAYIAYSRVPAGWLEWSAYAIAVSIACTAIVGFCPACAMVGRKSVPPRA